MEESPGEPPLLRAPLPQSNKRGDDPPAQESLSAGYVGRLGRCQAAPRVRVQRTRREGCIVCQDGESLSTEDVCKPFLEHRCGTGVAKLLFFDACRGGKKDKGKMFSRSGSVPKGGEELEPCAGNYLVVFSALPDHISLQLPPSPGSPSRSMWSELFAPKLADCDKSLTALLADVNEEMVDQCRDLLLQSESPNDSTTFQVAETTNALLGDVNLYASADKLKPRQSKHHYRG